MNLRAEGYKSRYGATRARLGDEEKPSALRDNDMSRSREKGMAYLPIEDHGIIGDLHTTALVGTDGTID
jgi:hypothetical protein